MKSMSSSAHDRDLGKVKASGHPLLKDNLATQVKNHEKPHVWTQDIVP